MSSFTCVRNGLKKHDPLHCGHKHTKQLSKSHLHEFSTLPASPKKIGEK